MSQWAKEVEDWKKNQSKNLGENNRDSSKLNIYKDFDTFREMNASAVGHYAGVNAMLTGNYMYTQGLRNKPMMPTIFEYLRKKLFFQVLFTLT